GLDIPGMPRCVPQLAPQRRHVDVEGPVHRPQARPPDLHGELVPADQLTGPPGQGHEEPEFLAGQIDRLAVPAHLIAVDVDLEIAGPHDPRRSGSDRPATAGAGGHRLAQLRLRVNDEYSLHGGSIQRTPCSDDEVCGRHYAASTGFGASIRPINGNSTNDSALATAQAAGSSWPGAS